MDNKKIGLFIAALRKEKKLTQKELAEKLFVSDKAVSKWECGLSLPDIGLLEKIADILGVTISDLLKGEKIKEFTKESSDAIVKESIPVFQKKYFKSKLIRIAKRVAIIIACAYVGLLIIGELNYGEVSWTIWGAEYSMDVPSFSSKKAISKSKQFLKALKEYDYDAIEKILANNLDRLYWNDEVILFENYINNLKELDKLGVKVTRYKYSFSYFNGRQYTTDFVFGIVYNDIEYAIDTQFQLSGESIVVSGIGSSYPDKLQINNPINNLKDTAPEVYEKIEKIFTY